MGCGQSSTFENTDNQRNNSKNNDDENEKDRKEDKKGKNNSDNVDNKEEKELSENKKSKKKELELLEIQENYIKEETNNLKVQYARGKQKNKLQLLVMPKTKIKVMKYAFELRNNQNNLENAKIEGEEKSKKLLK